MLNKIKNYPLVKDIGFVFSGNIFNGLINFIILLILTNSFDVSEYGIISLFWTLIIISSAIYEFGFGRSFLLLFGKSKKHLDRNKLIKSYNYLRIKSIYLFLFLYIVGESFGLFDRLLSFHERILIALTAIFYLIFLHYQSIYQIEKNLIKFSFFLTLPNLFRLILISLVVYFFHEFDKFGQVRSVEFSFMIAVFITALFTQIKEKNHLNICTNSKIDLDTTKSLLKGAVIFGIIGIINKVGMRIDNIIIYFFLNEKGVGLFNAANNLALVFPMLTMALLTVFFREFSLNSEKKIQHIQMIKKYQLRMLFPVLLLTIFLFIFSQDLIVLLLGENYEETAVIFQILVIPYLGGVFFTPFESFYYSYSRKFILIVKIAQFIIGIILTILFVIYFGIGGLGYSQLITRIAGWGIYSMKILNMS